MLPFTFQKHIINNAPSTGSNPFNASKRLLSTYIVIIGIPTCTLFSTTAHAQTPTQNTSPLSVLYECADILSDKERLACYDGKVASIKKAEENQELVAIDKESAEAIKKEAFGFKIPSLPRLGLPKLGNDEKSGKGSSESLVMDVTSIRRSGRKQIFTLENGSVWQETGGRFSYIPKGDLTATIKPAALGSYIISLSNGKVSVRGMRVRRIE